MLAWEWEIGGERLWRDWDCCGLWNWAGLCPISSRIASVFVPGLTWLAPGALRQLLWRWLWLQPASAPAKVSILARPRSIILQNCKTVKLQCKLWTVFSEAERERAKIMRPAERFVNYALPLYSFFHCGSHLALLLAFLGNRKSFVAQFAL